MYILVVIIVTPPTKFCAFLHAQNQVIKYEHSKFSLNNILKSTMIIFQGSNTFSILPPLFMSPFKGSKNT